jgi:hypothetical protein
VAGPVVDTLSALEFRREILDRITAEELQAIAAGLERKSAAMRDVLLAGERLDRAALRRVLRLVFAARRKADRILAEAGPDRLAAAVADLIDGAGDVAGRFDRFAEVVAAGAAPGFDLAGELLHFTYPERYWLWTRWLWDPGTRTGALGLVTTEDIDLTSGATPGAVYLTVGRATAFVNETGKAAGFTDAAPGLFGADMFLAAVYGVYLFTVLRMRMTREFTQIVPPLPDLIRRLLGVYYQEANDAHSRA